jgi:hypothetical protein
MRKSQVEQLFVREVREPWQSWFHFCDAPSALSESHLSASQIAIGLLGLPQSSVVGNVFALCVDSIHL